MHANHSSIDYTIPPTGIPELKMRVRTFGVQKVKGKEMLALRISFARPTGEVTPKHPEREFMNPGEQIVRIGENQIKPAFVHTRARKNQLIELNGLASETIDFLFPIPPGNKGADEIEILYFKWLVHYGKGKVESQTARFDRYDAAPQQAAEPYPFDNDYPYDVSPMQMPGWYIDEDPFWWPGPWMM
jgi:hypothetical protein